MPNHILNRLKLSGNPQKIKALVSSLSTFHPSTQAKSYSGELVWEHKTDKYSFLWYNEKEDCYVDRKNNKFKQLPKEYKPKMEDEWTRFPDFNKIIKMPDDLNISEGPGQFAQALLFGTGSRLFLGLPELLKRFKSLSHEERHKEVDLALKIQANKEAYGYESWYGWCRHNWGTKWNAYSCEKINNNVYQFETAWSGVPKLIKIIAEMHPEVEIVYEYSDECIGSNCGKFELKGKIVNETKIESESKEAYELAFDLRPECKEDFQLVDGQWFYKDDDGE